jgi:hypothetical protein
MQIPKGISVHFPPLSGGEETGFKTVETQYMKNLNWAGNRLGHAGLLIKVRDSHWELTPLGMTRDFSDTELALFVAQHNK